MKEELSIDIIGLAGACSYALDSIEAEFVNIKNKHGKRKKFEKVMKKFVEALKEIDK